MNPVVTADARAHVDGILAALRSHLPASYASSVFEAQGPANPAAAVPYLVAYFDLGSPEGYPFAPGRDFAMTIALRGVGLTPEQAHRAAQRGRDVLLSGAVVVAGRRVVFWQDHTAPVQRDDSVSPPVFEQLVAFDLRSDPS